MFSSPAVASYHRGYRRVPGWLSSEDFRLIDWFLADQRREGITGDVLEIGSYLGKTALLLALTLGPDERLVTCDLFDDPGVGARNRRERGHYRDLHLDTFKEQFTSRDIPLPEIHQCSSLELPERLPADAFRFVHVDGSHLYDFVKADLSTAEQLLGPQGLVVCDDYRTLHAAGVSAAVWEAVMDGGLRVICVTDVKLYATWTGDVAALQERVGTWARSDPAFKVREADIAGAPYLVMHARPRVDRYRRAVRQTRYAAARRLRRASVNRAG